MEETVSHLNAVKMLISAQQFPPKECSTDGTMDSFKDSLVSISKLVSHDVTKITILFSSPPYPETSTILSLFNAMVSRLKLLQLTFQQMPRTAGRILHNKVKDAIEKIMDSAIAFVTLVKAFQESPREGGMELLKTSQIWESCDQVANLPLFPTECVREFIAKQSALVSDAYDELVAAAAEEPSSDNLLEEEEEEFHATYAARHREILPYCTALVKCAVGLLKKVSLAIKRSGRSSTVEEVDQLDTIADACSTLSPCVDDFTMAAEPPLDFANVKEEAHNLTKKLREILGTVRSCHFITEDDEKWIEVLAKALDHNLKKIEEVPGVA